MNAKQSTLALLGGSFDPIHYGHIKPALEAANLLNIDKIRLLPNRISPLKQTSTSSQHKLSMLQLATEQFPKFEIDTRELDQAQPNYTVQTLKAIRAEHSDGPLCFIMGYDSLISLPRWHNWQQLLDYANLIVCQRPDQHGALPIEIKALLVHARTDKIDGKQGGIILVNTQAQPISSSLIRHKIKNFQSIKGLMPSAVINYIHDNRLYLDDE